MIDLRCGDCLELMKDIPDKSLDEKYFNIARERIEKNKFGGIV